MSDGVFFIVGRASVSLTTRDAFRRILLASKDTWVEVIVHVEVISLEPASEAAIATVFAC